MALETYVYSVVYTGGLELPARKEYTVAGDGDAERNAVLATQLNHDFDAGGHTDMYAVVDLNMGRASIYKGTALHCFASVYREQRVPNDPAFTAEETP